jgi:hypothetical protein
VGFTGLNSLITTIAAVSASEPTSSNDFILVIIAIIAALPGLLTAFSNLSSSSSIISKGIGSKPINLANISYLKILKITREPIDANDLLAIKKLYQRLLNFNIFIIIIYSIILIAFLVSLYFFEFIFIIKLLILSIFVCVISYLFYSLMFIINRKNIIGINPQVARHNFFKEAKILIEISFEDLFDNILQVLKYMNVQTIELDYDNKIIESYLNYRRNYTVIYVKIENQEENLYLINIHTNLHATNVIGSINMNRFISFVILNFKEMNKPIISEEQPSNQKRSWLTRFLKRS